jgi:hypothetical protein
MSHLTRIKMKIADKEMLMQVLPMVCTELGLNLVKDKLKFKYANKNSQKAANRDFVLVDTSGRQIIGYVNQQELTLEADFYYMQVKEEQLKNAILKQYAHSAIIKYMAESSISEYTERVDQDGTIIIEMPLIQAQKEA